MVYITGYLCYNVNILGFEPLVSNIQEETMRHYRPDRAGLSTLRLLILAFTAGIIIAVNYFVPIRFPALVADLCIAGVSLLVTLIYLPLFFSTINYTVSDTEITCSSGVFIKYHQTIKIAAVQYTAVVTTPLSGLTGLNFAVFFVYGGRMQFYFLSKKDISEILALTGTGGEPE